MVEDADSPELALPAETLTADDDTATAQSGGTAASDGGWEPDRRYELLAEHGRGGLGRVFRAVDRHLDRSVAVKELLPGAASSAEARFLREALITARLEHPGIVPVYEAGRWASGEPFYAMKLVSGRPLRELIREAGSLRARLSLVPHVIAVADAVAYAHSKNVVHRDLKPANVIVGEFGETMVIDWGLAKEVGSADPDGPTVTVGVAADVTTAGDVVGTPAYMAPEQAAGEDVSPAADVYALGAVLYEVLSGSAPYADVAGDDILRRARDGAPTPLADRDGHIPRELIAVVERAMQRDADARYGDARAFAEELRRFRSGQLVGAYHYTRTQLVGRWLRRHWPGLAAVAMVAVVGAVGMVVQRAGGAATISCDVDPAEFAGVWDEDVKATLLASFVRERPGLGRAIYDRVVAGVDEYVARWKQTATASCEATHHSGHQSLAMLDARSGCLLQRKQALAGVMSVLTDELDVQVVDRALTMIARLPSLKPCSDAESLTARLPPPEDAGVRDQVDRLRGRLAEIDALEKAGKADLGLGRARVAVADARAIEYTPVQTEAGYRLQRIENVIGYLGDDAPLPWDLLEQAARDRDDVMVARLWIEVVTRLGNVDRFDEAFALRQPLLAAAARVSYQPGVAAEAHIALGRLHVRKHQFVLARADLSRAIEYLEAVDPRDWRIENALYENATAHFYAGEYVEAARDFRRTLELKRAVYGDDHPGLAPHLSSVGNALFRQGNLVEGLMYLREGFELSERYREGRADPRLGGEYGNLGTVYLALGQFDEAYAHFEIAYSLGLELPGPEGRLQQAIQLANLCSTSEARGDTADAGQRCDASIAIAEKLEAFPMFLAWPLSLRAAVLNQLGRYEESLRMSRSALAVMRSTGSEAHEHNGVIYSIVGEALLGMGRARESLRAFERAVEITGAGNADRRYLAEAQFGVARALRALGRDDDRARALALDSLRLYVNRFGVVKEFHEVLRWLSEPAEAE